MYLHIPCGATIDISLPLSGLKHSIPLAAVWTHEAGEAITSALATNPCKHVEVRSMVTLRARG
jgi:hypothetical protein